MSGNFQVPIAEVESDTGRWVSALFEAPPGITLVGSSERLTWEQWLTLWGNRNGVKTRYREASVEEYAAKAPGISDALAEEFRFVEEYGFAGGNSGAIYPEQVSDNPTCSPCCISNCPKARPNGYIDSCCQHFRPHSTLRLVEHSLDSLKCSVAVALRIVCPVFE